MTGYTLGLFANMYPAYDGDYRGSFIRQMVGDLESRGIRVNKAVKISSSVSGYIPFCIKSLRLARDRDIDLFQAEYIPHSSLIPAVIGRKDIPLVLKFHGDDARIFPFQNSINLAVTRWMLDRADHVITSSEEMKQCLVRIGGDPGQITPVHTGVDTVFFSPGERDKSRLALAVPETRTVFLFVGRLHLWKGVSEIIRIAEQCHDFLFVFVGPGKIPAHPENCIFAGVQPPEKVREWLHAADCFILPTYTESVPTSVMEAFACGIPAITTDVGGCPEIVEHGKNGLMVPVKDIPALKDAVLWMHAHPTERTGMGRRARETAVERYDHNVLIEKVIAVHRNLLD